MTLFLSSLLGYKVIEDIVCLWSKKEEFDEQRNRDVNKNVTLDRHNLVVMTEQNKTNKDRGDDTENRCKMTCLVFLCVEE